MIDDFTFLNSHKKYVESICGNKDISFKLFRDHIKDRPDEIVVAASIYYLMRNKETRKIERWDEFGKQYDKHYKSAVQIYILMEGEDIEKPKVAEDKAEMAILLLAAMVQTHFFLDVTTELLIKMIEQAFHLGIDGKELKKRIKMMKRERAETIIEALNDELILHNTLT